MCLPVQQAGAAEVCYTRTLIWCKIAAVLAASGEEGPLGLCSQCAQDGLSVGSTVLMLVGYAGVRSLVAYVKNGW